MNIIAQGVFYFAQTFPTGRRVLMDVAGDTAAFNGATVTLGYKGADGEFTPYAQADGTAVAITARAGFEVRVPRSGEVGVSITVADPNGLILDVIAAVDMPPGS